MLDAYSEIPGPSRQRAIQLVYNEYGLTSKSSEYREFLHDIEDLSFNQWRDKIENEPSTKHEDLLMLSCIETTVHKSFPNTDCIGSLSGWLMVFRQDIIRDSKRLFRVKMIFQASNSILIKLQALGKFIVLFKRFQNNRNELREE